MVPKGISLVIPERNFSLNQADMFPTRAEALDFWPYVILKGVKYRRINDFNYRFQNDELERKKKLGFVSLFQWEVVIITVDLMMVN